MNKEQAIKLFEGLIKDSEQAKKVWELGDTGYYTSEALISAYNLAISVVKVIDVEEQTKQDNPVVKPFDEQQDDKVEVPDFIAKLICKYKAKKETLVCSISNLYRESDEYKWYVDNAEIYERAWVDGYTMEQPERWVVKANNFGIYFTSFRPETLSGIFGTKKCAKTFTDKAKAEAVATLVEGSVEEVSE